MELDRLITQIVKKARDIRLIVSQLEELRFPSSSPLRLAYLINNIAQAIEDEILTRYRKGPSSLEDFEVVAKLAAQALEYLWINLQFTEQAATQQVPWSLVRSLERISEQLLPESCFIICPQWYYNYSICELISIYHEKLSQLLAKDRLSEVLKLNHNASIKQLHVIGFPYLDRLSVLMHTLVGHELGHPIEKEYFDQEKLPDFILKLLRAVLKELKAPEDLQRLDLFQMTEANRMLGRVLMLRRRALEELICDLVSVNLFGPAALFATEEFVLSRDLDTINPPLEYHYLFEYHYPPWRYRLRVMWQELPSEWVEEFIRQGQFDNEVASCLNSKLDFIRKLIEQDTDKQNIKKSKEARIAYESVEETLPKAREFVKQKLKERGYCLDDLLGKVNTHLLRRLEDWIPPDAYIDDNTGHEIVSDIRYILNVGWLRWICKYAAMPTTENTVEINKYFQDIDTLNSLVLKALEYTDLRHVWRQAKGEQECR